MCNEERRFSVPQKAIDEMARNERFIKAFDTLRNIENDFPLLISSANDR